MKTSHVSTRNLRILIRQFAYSTSPVSQLSCFLAASLDSPSQRTASHPRSASFLAHPRDPQNVRHERYEQYGVAIPCTYSAPTLWTISWLGVYHSDITLMSSFLGTTLRIGPRLNGANVRDSSFGQGGAQYIDIVEERELDHTVCR